MKLGLVFGYWGAQPHPNFVPLSQEAERLGFDSVWVAESWGNDAFTFAAWVAAHTNTTINAATNAHGRPDARAIMLAKLPNSFAILFSSVFMNFLLC
jgi:alkanesulfonate monooxygenase SsuD/methylene tetrahydromethanopterin reductase-like flavin-dependent oxidoreductase (luciferase family)